MRVKRWRRGWDLNPRYPLRYVRFRGGSFQPLTHLSGKQLSVVGSQSPVRSNEEPMTNDQRLATVSKERLQHLCAPAGKHSAANFNPMIQLRMIYDLHHRLDRAGFRILRSVNQPPNARMHQRSCAHRARFNCSKQLALAQTMVTNGSTGLAQRNDLGVSRRIAVSNVAVPPAAHDAPLAHHNSPHGNFA